MKKVAIIFLLILLFSSGAQAHVFRLSTEKSTYEPGDEIMVNLTIKNTADVNKNMDIYVVVEEENGRYPPMGRHYSLDLSAGEERNITVYRENVTEYLVNGFYTVHATLMEDGFSLYEDTIGFSIIGLPETMEITILLSNNSNFTSFKDVFVEGEKIYVGHNASTDNVSIDCTLTYPDGSSKSIEVPCSFVLEENGIYKITMNASKEGYRSVSKTAQFAVIKSPYAQPTEPQIGENNMYLFILVGFLILIIIALLRLKKK